MGLYEKAEPLYQQALQIYQKALGPDHPSTATSLGNLAALYVQMGAYEKAEPLYQQALQIYQRRWGPNTPAPPPASTTWRISMTRWVTTERPQGPAKERGQKVEALEQEVERIEGELTQNVAGLGRARRASCVSVEQVQAVLPQDSALIEYVHYEHYLGKGASDPRYGAVVLAAIGDPV